MKKTTVVIKTTDGLVEARQTAKVVDYDVLEWVSNLDTTSSSAYDRANEGDWIVYFPAEKKLVRVEDHIFESFLGQMVLSANFVEPKKNQVTIPKAVYWWLVLMTGLGVVQGALSVTKLAIGI